MADDKTSGALVKPAITAITAGESGEQVVSRMVSEAMCIARRHTALNTPQLVKLGEFELREPDYRQVCRWASELGEQPEALLARLCGSVVTINTTYEGPVLRLQDGRIQTLVLSGAYLPIRYPEWEPGLNIKTLVIADRCLEQEPGSKNGKVVIEDYPYDWGSCRQLPTLHSLLVSTSSVVVPKVFAGDQLKELSCDARQLSNFDLSQIPELTRLICYGARSDKPSDYYEFDLSPLEKLTELHFWDVPLRKLDLTPVPKLVELTCIHTQLNELDLSPVPKLTILWCHTNNLRELDLSPVSNLTELHCSYNQISKINLEAAKSLTRLECWNNELTELDLSQAPNVTELICCANELAQLDLLSVPNLVKLDCSGNELNELDLSPVQELKDLDCSYNQLSALDLSSAPNLTKLLCYGNRFSELDLRAIRSQDIQIQCGKNVRIIR